MSIELKQVIDQVLPYTKKKILDQEVPIKSSINEWLKSKGFLISFLSDKLVSIAWDLLIGPALPFIINITFGVVSGMFAPYLVPFLPVIDRYLDYINDKYLSALEKQLLLDIIHLMVKHKDGLPQLEVQEKIELLNEQEYFSSI